MATGSDSGAPPSSTIPRRLGRYTLLKRIAKGGMGEVLLAATSGIEGAERPVIVKMIREEHRTDASFRARFLDEARVQAQLAHSGVASILDATTDDATGEPYVVVEHVDGRNLGDVRSRALATGAHVDWAESVAVAHLVAEALAHVHDRRDPSGQPLAIVHRDLSPQNVMVAFTGDVKLIDFGTARGQNRRCHTVAGVVFAKPGYVAPEVANGDPGDFRVDLYALGVMLWELCAGRRFLEGDAADHLAAVAAGARDLPAIAVACGGPSRLDEVIARLTAHDRAERYATTRDAARDLAGLLGDAPSLAGGERGVRGRIAALLARLFPGESPRFRREFARLVDDARRRLAVADAPRTIPAPPPLPAIEPPPAADEIEAEPGTGAEPATGARTGTGTETETATGTGTGTGTGAGAGTENGTGAGAGTPATDLDGLLPGTRWRLVRELGRGAFAVVWEGVHADLGQRAAIKVHPGGERGRSRYRNEARALSRVKGPGVARLLEAGVASDGRPFTVLELHEGQTLDTWARARDLSVADALLVARKILIALEDVHAARLVHRDLKPSNVLCGDDGSVRLLDLGLAADLDATATDEPPSGGALALHGTPAYMAPEQASGVADERSDVYAVGCMLYELLAGSLPFDGDGEVGALAAKAKGSPEPLGERCPMRGVPADVDDLVLRALARHASVRFQTARAMREAIQRSEEAPARRRSRRRGGAMAALALAMLAGLCVAAVPHVPGAEAVVARVRGAGGAPAAVVVEAAAPAPERAVLARAELPQAILDEELALRALEEADASAPDVDEPATADVLADAGGDGEAADGLDGEAEEREAKPAPRTRRAASGRERRERRDGETTRRSSTARSKDAAKSGAKRAGGDRGKTPRRSSKKKGKRKGSPAGR